MSRPDYLNLAAIATFGLPEDWVWQRSTVITPNRRIGFTLEGAVPVGVYTKGPRKGRVKWPKKLETVVLLATELDAFIENYEKENNV